MSDTVPRWVLVTLSVFAAPTLVVIGWLVLDRLRIEVPHTRFWPRCEARFEPADDPDYRTTCRLPRWHKDKHYDGSYLFSKETPND